MIRDRLFGWQYAFDHPATAWLTLAALGALALASVAIFALSHSGRLAPELKRELWLRTGSWMALVPAMLLVVLLGATWTIAAVLALALWCYSEYARATGLFREGTVSATVVVGIFAVHFAALDHWYGFFAALAPISVSAIAVSTIFADRPQGYVQRTSLGVFGFLLFGSGLGHLAYMANDWNYRPILLLIVFAVALSDVAAFVVGKLLGGPKLAPHTSPGKTVSGALGSLLLTAATVALVAGAVFPTGPMASLPHRVGLGLLLGAAAQLGDLMLSSIKRDIGIKDMGAAIPGHGGVLDRFNSLLLAAPATFHYVGYFAGFGLDQPTRILTGG